MPRSTLNSINRQDKISDPKEIKFKAFIEHFPVTFQSLRRGKACDLQVADTRALPISLS